MKKGVYVTNTRESVKEKRYLIVGHPSLAQPDSQTFEVARGFFGQKQGERERPKTSENQAINCSD